MSLRNVAATLLMNGTAKFQTVLLLIALLSTNLQVLLSAHLASAPKATSGTIQT